MLSGGCGGEGKDDPMQRWSPVLSCLKPFPSFEKKLVRISVVFHFDPTTAGHAFASRVFLALVNVTTSRRHFLAPI